MEVTGLEGASDGYSSKVLLSDLKQKVAGVCIIYILHNGCEVPSSQRGRQNLVLKGMHPVQLFNM